MINNDTNKRYNYQDHGTHQPKDNNIENLATHDLSPIFQACTITAKSTPIIEEKIIADTSSLLGGNNPAEDFNYDINAQLVEAFDRELPAFSAWLISQGADIEQLGKISNITKSQQELLDWLKLKQEVISVEPKNLDHFALKLGFGYKSANLMVMEAKAQAMSEKLKHSEIKVPPFFPISDYEMTHLLKLNIPEVFEMWDQFLNTFDNDQKKAFTDALSQEHAAKIPLKISPEGEKQIKLIQARIKDFFNKNFYHTPQIALWLQNENPEFLIVRSTGKEDSDNNSNAGGNESVPYVIPSQEKIAEALGEVVASYFGEKSINQRLAAGDQSLFSERKPFMPVLLQTMVGENVAGVGVPNNQVPRCGVLFTRQADKAQGVTFIQTGLGNNEGVVSSQVGVDSYYVKDDKIHAVVRDKKTRFVPIKDQADKYKVEQIKNDRTLAKLQALPNQVILDLKKIADILSEDYGAEKGVVKPMDMEYTVKLTEKGKSKPVIYLLQARPLLDTQGKEKIEHTYLDLSALNSISESRKLNVEILLDGNAWVREISNPEAVLFVDDLPQGLKEYLKHRDPNQIKVIISRKTAPATSHEAVTLRPKGVAVIVVSDKEQYTKLKLLNDNARGESPLLVDTQRGIVMLTPKGNNQMQMIIKGQISYPIPLEASIPESILMKLDTAKLEGNLPAQNLLKGVLEHYNNWSTDLIKDLSQKRSLDKIEMRSLRELFDIMATKDTYEAKIALGCLLKTMKQTLVKSMHEADGDLKTLNQPLFQVFEASLKLIQREIIPALEKYPPQSLERLYPLKFLDAMIFQRPSDNVKDAHSYAQVLQTIKNMTNIKVQAMQEGVDLKDSYVQELLVLYMMSRYSFNRECAASWKEFIKMIAQMPVKEQEVQIQNLMQIYIEMDSLGMSEVWMNTLFKKAWDNASAIRGNLKVEQIIQELSQVKQQNDKLFEWIKDKVIILNGLEQQIPMWSDPAFATKKCAKLKALFQNELGFDPQGNFNSVEKMYNSGDELGKIAVLQYIRSAVNIYDCIIKAAKGSSVYASDKQKAQIMSEMLEGYFDMMRALFRLISDKDEQKRMNKPAMGSAMDFDNFILGLENGHTYVQGLNSAQQKSIGFNTLIQNLPAMPNAEVANQFIARQVFSVDSMVVTHKGDKSFGIYWPERLEEYFTTFHQNMEVVISYLNVKNGMDENILERKAKLLIQAAKSKFNQEMSTLTQEGGRIRVGYNIPLRQHSATLTLDYNPKDSGAGIDVTMHLFGSDEHDRWDQSAAYGAALGYIFGEGLTNGLAPKINYAKPTEVQFQIHLGEDFHKPKKLINAFYNLVKVITIKENFLWGQDRSQELLGHLENDAGPVDWTRVNEECFRHTFYLNHALLQRFDVNSNHLMLFKVAKNSLIGLVGAKLDDYKRGKLDSLPGLREASLQAIEKALNNLPQVGAELEPLLNDPDIRKLPEIHTRLKIAHARTLPPKLAFKNFMDSGDLGGALIYAIKKQKMDLFALAHKQLLSLLKSGDRVKAFKIYDQLVLAGEKAIAKQLFPVCREN